MKFNTKTIHGGQIKEKAYGAVMPPIYQTSTYSQKSPGEHSGYEYSRTQNPTRHALERSIASLENAKYGLAFSSGLSAIDAVMKLFSPGDEIISTNDLYGGSYRLFNKIYAKFGLKFIFTDLRNLKQTEKLVTNKTKLIWVETPTNPMINIIDIKGLSKICKSNNLLLAVDNTFSTPYLQKPMDLGADIIMHSATKFLAGHSDVILGLLALSNDELAEKLYFIQNSSGAICGPMDSFLTLRGIKTLHVRMKRHCENAKVIATFLNNHNKVDKVYWPGFENHLNHDVAKSQMSDYGGMISFTLKGDFELVKKITSSFKVFTLAESLGGVESLVNHPATMTHASIPKEERDKIGIADNLIRLSVGIEDISDLVDDIKQAIN
jgi:cystathionine beta-lyase|tara:strand:+ start:501 stop:1637 length:1137 start_codon:yes stop_codon:yes gene_type:complete